MARIRTNRPLLPVFPHNGARTIRQRVLSDTIEYIIQNYDDLHKQAQENLESWHQKRSKEARPEPSGLVELFEGDWGEVTLQLTRHYGEVFAVLNMANAYAAGGAYQKGTAAQEENMFRRTDCHLALHEKNLVPYEESGPGEPLYKPALTALLNAVDGRVMLDTEQHRVCIRGPERLGTPGEGYHWLAQDEIFPFYELRAAAVDLRYHLSFDPTECKRRFHAMLDTLADAKQNYAVLGAHGCGAFGNPSEQVAQCFAEILRERRHEFSMIAFAIYHAGYGPNNYKIFKEVFDNVL